MLLMMPLHNLCSFFYNKNIKTRFIFYYFVHQAMSMQSFYYNNISNI